MGIVYKGKTIHSLNVYNDQYVHGRAEDVRWSSVNLALRRDDKGASILSRYLSRLKTQIQVTDAATGSLVDLESLGDQTLVSLMDQIAEAMNEEVQKQLPNLGATLSEAMDGAYQNVNIINQNGSVNSTAFNNLMDSIFKALQLVTNSTLTAEQWTAFTVLYRHMFDKRFNQSKLNTQISMLISEWDLQQGSETVRRVVDLLRNIPSNLIDKSGRFTNSVRGSVTQIMHNTIAKDLSLIAANAGADAAQKIDFILTSAGAQRTSFQRPGSRAATQTSSTIYNKNGITITSKAAKTGDQTYEISGQLDANVQWMGDRGSGTVTMVNPFARKIQIANYSSLVSWIEKVYAKSLSDMYGVYNTLAWRSSNAAAASAYQILQTSIIETNLDLFLAGKSNRVGDIGFDLSSFLLINGEFYSMAGILYLLEQEIKRGAARDVVSMGIAGKFNEDEDNRWLNKRGDPRNVAKALRRSSQAKKALNRLGFTVTLNGPALQKKLATAQYNAAKLTI